MSAANLTAEEMSLSLTGFDEIAIEKHFEGFDIYADAERKPMKALRALVFVHRRREGDEDAEAKQAALDMPLGDVQDYFIEDEEITPNAPETEPGKDSSPDDDEPDD